MTAPVDLDALERYYDASLPVFYVKVWRDLARNVPTLIMELRAARHAITLLLERVEDIGCVNCHRQHRTANPDGKPPCVACAEAIAAAAIAKGTP